MSYSRKQFERYLTEDEENKLFKYVAKFADVMSRRDYAWMGILRQSGIRVKAMSLFTVSDARKTLSTGYFHIRAETNKGGKAHTCRANKKALTHLRALLLIRLEMGYVELPNKPLVMSRNHKGLSIRSYQERMKHWRNAAGLGCDVSPHWFRHTLAKRIIKTSVSRNPLAIVQVALGHSSITSSGVYTMPDKEEMELSMEAAS